jgi:hypothetical protein
MLEGPEAPNSHSRVKEQIASGLTASSPPIAFSGLINHKGADTAKQSVKKP